MLRSGKEQRTGARLGCGNGAGSVCRGAGLLLGVTQVRWAPVGTTSIVLWRRTPQLPLNLRDATARAHRRCGGCSDIEGPKISSRFNVIAATGCRHDARLVVFNHRRGFDAALPRMAAIAKLFSGHTTGNPQRYSLNEGALFPGILFEEVRRVRTHPSG